MEAQIKENGLWLVKGDSGHDYETSLTSCTCPHYLHRMKNNGGICKHIAFIKELEDNKDIDNYIIVDFIRSIGKTSYKQIENKFGKDVSNKLKSLEQRGEIIYNKRYDNYVVLE